MKHFKLKAATLAAALLAAGIVPVQATIVITEVAPWGSGNGLDYKADWFELTNTGASAVNISGWKMDDNSDSFGSAVALRGVASIGAGKSVVFIEGGATASGDATLDAKFINTWFGATSPAGLTIGNYGGSGVGLSATSDAVNIFNGSGTLITGVTFGASPAGPGFASFDNAAGLTGAISLLSVVSTNGAFVAASDIHEIGSPGAVPEPETYAMLLAGLGLVGFAARRRRNSSRG